MKLIVEGFINQVEFAAVVSIEVNHILAILKYKSMGSERVHPLELNEVELNTLAKSIFNMSNIWN